MVLCLGNAIRQNINWEFLLQEEEYFDNAILHTNTDFQYRRKFLVRLPQGDVVMVKGYLNAKIRLISPCSDVWLGNTVLTTIITMARGLCLSAGSTKSWLVVHNTKEVLTSGSGEIITCVSSPLFHTGMESLVRQQKWLFSDVSCWSHLKESL